MRMGAIVRTPYGEGVVIWCTSLRVIVQVRGELRRCLPEECTWR